MFNLLLQFIISYFLSAVTIGSYTTSKPDGSDTSWQRTLNEFFQPCSEKLAKAPPVHARKMLPSAAVGSSGKHYLT